MVGSVAVTMLGVTGCQGDGSSGRPAVTVSVTAPGPTPGIPTASRTPTAAPTATPPVTPPTVSPRPTPPVSPTPSLPAPGERISLTLRDHGRTYAVRLSTRIRLVLPDDLIWTMPKGDMLDVQRVMSDAPMGVKEWEIRPTGTGRTTLTTTGMEISRDPRTGPPVCAPPSPSCHEYRVTFDIS
ncbi:hypothetical protein OG394_10925 [Kribbella sp. NBC_01245]|uniref:hypothetical protein n=1 Tax=Kribbella sp. NBC_01245 TaxID=2903578 RepID=UPI002E2C71C9|nr:hypothetical protein [Kribbella sp. NBC_01245]